MLNAVVTQLVEWLPEEERVEGSNPFHRTNHHVPNIGFGDSLQNYFNVGSIPSVVSKKLFY